MSNELAHGKTSEHGTMRSYIIGFILSLVFTFIPYFMVVNQVITGTSLLVMILGCAVIQMLIQIVFFLHLGRGPQALYNIAFFAMTIGTILIVVGGSVVIMENLHYNKKPSDQVKVLVEGEGIYQVGGVPTGACQGQHQNHRVTITEGVVSPVYILAKKCDTLTFTNEDSDERKISFRVDDKQITYAGLSEVMLRTGGYNKTITLSETGSFTFYDYAEPDINGNITITP